jgi:hypothetical protein
MVVVTVVMVVVVRAMCSGGWSGDDDGGDGDGGGDDDDRGCDIAVSCREKSLKAGLRPNHECDVEVGTNAADDVDDVDDDIDDVDDVGVDCDNGDKGDSGERGNDNGAGGDAGWTGPGNRPWLGWASGGKSSRWRRFGARCSTVALLGLAGAALLGLSLSLFPACCSPSDITPSIS